MDTFESMRDWNLRYGNEGSRVGQPGRVLGGAEYGNAVVWCTERFDTFEGLLSIVDSRGHAVKADVRVCNETRRTPFSSLARVMRLDVPVHFGGVSIDEDDEQLRPAPSRTRKPISLQSGLRVSLAS